MEQIPPVKNERVSQAIAMKLKGHSNREIAKATGIPLKKVQNILTKGGRLYPALEALRAKKMQVVQEGNLSSWERLCLAQEPAIEELRRIAKEDPNPAARLKAIDMIFDLTGVRGEDKLPILDPANLEESSQRFIEWADELLLKTFRERAPGLIAFDRSSKTANPYEQYNLLPELAAHLCEVLERNLEVRRHLLEQEKEES